MTTLTLGGVVFSDFEIPESINFGGEQSLIIHKMPGGNRVIDAMGPDDADIRWSGRFRGAAAEERALLLDYMRRSGNTFPLAWSFNLFTVVIREFTANFQQSYEIPYTISCTVVLNATQAIAQAAIGFLESLASDLVSAVGLSGIIGNSTINAAVTSVAAAVTNVQAGVPVTTSAIAGAAAVAEGPLLGGVLSAIGTAQTTVQSAIAGTTVNTQPVTAGGAPSGMANALTSAASGFLQLSGLYQLSSILSRMSTNTVNARN